MPRASVAMSAQEVGSFLASQRDLQVASIGKDGYPHLATMWYAVIDGLVCFGSFRKSQKIVNVRRDPRLTCLTSSGETYRTLRGVMIRGTARIVEDEQLVAEHSLTISRRNQPDEPDEVLRAAALATAARRALVFVEPVRITSWDHTKLG